MRSAALNTDQLIAMYNEYKELTEQIGKLEKTQAKLILTGQDTSATERMLYSVAQKRAKLSDTMTFDAPRIWIEYKYRAYQNEAQPIATMHDLRLHCSKPDYICKRYTFLNDELVAQGRSPLSDRSDYPDSMSLNDLLNLDVLDRLQDHSYEQWRSHEYYQQAGIVAKWESYTKP